MNIWIKTVCLIALLLLAMRCVRKIIESTFNLLELLHDKKHPGSLPRSEGGIVFNKKTGKLEETSGHIVLPFD